MICEIDGRVLGGMQFGGAGAVLGCWLALVLFEVLVTVWAHFCKNDGRVLGGMQFGALAGSCCGGVGAFLRLTARC